MRVAHSGRAKINWRHPRALGECDRCGFWHNRDQMIRQTQWAGNSLIDTGLIVGKDCLDVPQDQFRNPILPPDPRPINNPRPSANVTPIVYIGGPIATTPENQGFSQYVLEPSFVTDSSPPPAQQNVLNQVAAISDVPTPSVGLVSYVVPMTTKTVTLVPANVNRTFLLLFNPTQFTAQVSLGTATQGAITNLSIGPNEAYFWADEQGLTPTYKGAVTAIGLYAPLVLWAWENSSNLVVLFDDSGVLALTADGLGYPTSPVGLPPGAVWDNGRTIGVIPGVTPNPAAPPVFFGSVTAQTLLALGGGNLPKINPNVFDQLYNDGGMIAVSFGSSNQLFVTDQFGNVVTDQNGNPIPIF